MDIRDIQALNNKLNFIVNFIKRVDELQIEKILYVLIALLCIMIFTSFATSVIVMYKTSEIKRLVKKNENGKE
jgi:preprotein translocase subunit SecY